MMDLENLITKIITYSDKGQKPSIHKFNKNWILTIIEENEDISRIHQDFLPYDQRVPHNETETIFVVIGLVELFKDICDSLGLTTHVTSNDVINYIVDTFLDGTPVESHALATRKLPPQKHFNQSETKIRDIDINAPVVYGEFFDPIKRLVKSKMLSDSLHHVNDSVKEACYASEIKKIFCLDFLSDCINIYNTECKLEKKISPKAFDEIKDVMILNFAWSNKQLRLGACLKDFSLVFWDASDNFEFQKNVVLGNSTNQCQSNIWYLEFLNSWVTTDQTNALNVWDLSDDSLVYSLHSDRVNSTIIELVPLEVIKLVAAASMDKKVTIWNFSSKSILLEVRLPNGGVHSMVYCATFQTLVTAGFENAVSLWEISPHYFDHTLRGRLIGHRSMITAVEVIERTPMVISADDTGHIKVWDIRTFKCLQTLDMGPLTVVSQLIDMYQIGKLGFSGTRVNMLVFEDAYELKNKFNAEIQLWPIRVEYNPNVGELIICTSKDLQFIDVNTGRVKKIYSGLLTNSEDEITTFRLVHQNKKFILGDQHGRMGLYLYSTGELLKPLKAHGNEITSIKADYMNKTIISSSLDSSIIIQKENKLEFEVKRKVINGHFRKQIVLMETSIYHNLLVTGARDNILYVWDYEYARLVASITLEEEAEPTAVNFINGYGIIVISTTCGTIHFFHFFRKDSASIEMKRIAFIDVDPKQKYASVESFFENRGTIYANRLLIDLQYDPEGIKKPEEGWLYTSLNDGKVIVFDIKQLFELSEVVLVSHANSKKNYNAGRITNENFEESVKIYKIFPAKLYHAGSKQQEVTPVNNSMAIPNSPRGQKPGGKANFSMAYVQFSNANLTRAKIDSRSEAMFLKLMSGGDDLPKEDSMNVSLANASESDFEREKVEKFFDLSHQIKLSFKAHNDSLTTLLFMTYPDKKLLTGSLDSCVKVWELNGELAAALNVNHPLPMEWKIQAFSIDRVKKQILYGVKIIETIFKRYKGKIHVGEEKKININNFLKTLENNASNSRGALESITKLHSKPVLMQEEYESRDLEYQKVKDLYKTEIRGKSLKELEFIKGLMMAQDNWRENRKNYTESASNVQQQQYIKYENDAYDLDLMRYLVGDQSSKINALNKEKQANETKHLAAKLDAKLAALRKMNHLNSLALDRDRSYSHHHRGGDYKKTVSKVFVADNTTPGKLQVKSIKSVKSGTFEEGSIADPEPLSSVLSGRKPHLFKDPKAVGKLDFIHQDSRERPNSRSVTSTISHNALDFTKKKSQSQKNEPDSIQVIAESNAEDVVKHLSIMKKKSLPSINFYEYAGQKHLAPLHGSPNQSRINSNDVSVTYQKKLKKNELRGILSQLDRKLKHSQLSHSGNYVHLSMDTEVNNTSVQKLEKNHNHSVVLSKYPKLASTIPARPNSKKRSSLDFRDRFRKFAESEGKHDFKADRSRDLTRNESQSIFDYSIKPDDLRGAAEVKAFDLLMPHGGDANQTHYRSVGKSFDSGASSINPSKSKTKGSFFKDTQNSFSELSSENLLDFPPSKLPSRDKMSPDDMSNKNPSILP